jgi:hypothetical protein
MPKKKKVRLPTGLRHGKPVYDLVDTAEGQQCPTNKPLMETCKASQDGTMKKEIKRRA